MIHPLEIVAELIDGAVTVGTWRPLLCAAVAAPLAGLAYLVIPNSAVGSWTAGGILCGGLVAGLVWERRSNNDDGDSVV